MPLCGDKNTKGMPAKYRAAETPCSTNGQRWKGRVNQFGRQRNKDQLRQCHDHDQFVGPQIWFDASTVQKADQHRVKMGSMMDAIFEKKNSELVSSTLNSLHCLVLDATIRTLKFAIRTNGCPSPRSTHRLAGRT